MEPLRLDDRPLFVAALREEVAALRRFVPDARILVVGDGAARAAGNLARALDERDALPPAIVIVGFAGALAPDLEAGAVVTASSVQDGSAGSEGREGLAPPETPDPVWRARAEASGASARRFVSAPTLVSGPNDRAALRRSTEPESDVVDLESAALVAVAQGRRIPWCVVRAVTDTSVEKLPAVLMQTVRDDGSVDRGAVVRGALLRPWSIGALVALRRRARDAARAIGALCGQW